MGVIEGVSHGLAAARMVSGARWGEGIRGCGAARARWRRCGRVCFTEHSMDGKESGPLAGATSSGARNDSVPRTDENVSQPREFKDRV